MGVGVNVLEFRSLRAWELSFTEFNGSDDTDLGILYLCHVDTAAEKGHEEFEISTP